MGNALWQIWHDVWQNLLPNCSRLAENLLSKYYNNSPFDSNDDHGYMNDSNNIHYNGNNTTSLLLASKNERTIYSKQPK